MLTDLDFHAPSARLLVRRVDGDKLPLLVLHNLLTNTVITKIAQDFVPQGPRLSHDGQQLAFFSNHRLFVHDVASGQTRCVFDRPDLEASFCEWSPDDERLVFSAFPPDGLRSKQGLGPDIYCLHLTEGGLTQLTDDFTVNRFPQWSPDGLHVVFQRDDPVDRQAGTQVGVVEMATQKISLVPCAPGTSSRAERFSWSPDGTHLLILEQAASARLRVVRLADRMDVWEFKSETLRSGAFVPDGSILAVCRDELVRLAFPRGQIMESLSLSAFAPLKETLPQPNVSFDEQSQAVLFLTRDGRLYKWSNQECVLLLEDANEPLPEFQEELYVIASRDGRQTAIRRFKLSHPKPVAVMFVHGGPPGVGDANSIDADHFVALKLLREGYEIVCPAYRGMSENEGEYGRTDVWDVLDAGLDWQRRFGEARSLALVGYSYGGYLVSLALAQPAAPWSCGISLWGVTHPFGLHAARWLPSNPQEQAVALVERSPMEQATNIQVPLLILAGGRDFISPEEDIALIRDRILAQGVPCELTLYLDDTHGLPLHRHEVYDRILNFLARFG